DRVIVESVDRAPRSAWMSPVRATYPMPPIRDVPAIDGTARLDEHERPREQLVRQRARVILRPRRYLGKRRVAGCPGEPREPFVRHRYTVHPEAVNCDAMNRAFFLIVPVRSHLERPTRDPDDVGEGRLARRPWQAHRVGARA